MLEPDGVLVHLLMMCTLPKHCGTAKLQHTKTLCCADWLNVAAKLVHIFSAYMLQNYILLTIYLSFETM